MAKVSVIVPVYNVEKYIKKCLDSLVNQTLEDIEIIVVNDGSPDNSQKIIDRYVKKYPKKVKSYIKENGGLGSARNYGLTKATGEYIAFVDSDDYVDLEMYEKLYNIAKQKDIDIVTTTKNYRVENDLCIIDKFYRVNSDDNLKNFIINEAGSCNKIVKKTIIDKNNFMFFENHFYEDIAVTPALALYTKKVEIVDESFYYYVNRSGSIMNQVKYNKRLEDIFDSLNNLKSIFINQKQFKKYHDEIEYIYISHLLHDATLRFLPFEEGKENLNRIISLMDNEFPQWKKNKYLKTRNLKYKVVCYLSYKKYRKLLKFLLKINSKIK